MAALSWLGVGIPAFLFVITIVVFFHEFGHFAVARFFGVTIEAFSIGFGREIVGWTDRRGTRWKICWLPFGGYVRFLGDADAASRPDNEKLEKLKAEAQNDSASAQANPISYEHALQNKPLYQRALVVAAGPIANFILAIVIFTAVCMIVGKAAEPPAIQSLLQGSPAEAIGLKAGDILRSVDGRPIAVFSDLVEIVSGSAGRPLDLVVSRGGMDMNFHVTPRSEVITDPDGVKQTIGQLGIAPTHASVGVFQAVGLATNQTWAIVEQTLGYLGKTVAGRENGRQLHGPLGILNVSHNFAEGGILALFNLAGLISVSLGLVNLFPIPILDGGHLLYYACEAVLGRPLGARAQEMGFRVGLAFVLSLMLFATFNDLVRFNLF